MSYQLLVQRSSHRWKGWVLDRWADLEYAGAPRRHVVGFAAEETRRRDRDEGYAVATPGKRPWYPLIEEGWDRQRCLDALHRWFSIEWPRSCCGFCPFQAGPDVARMRRRWRAEPGQARTAVAMERNARALNPRMTLFGRRSAEDLARAFGLGATVEQAAGELDARPAALYEVRRIYRRRGDRRTRDGRGWQLGPDPADKARDVWRSLRTIAEGDRADMLTRLHTEHTVRGGNLDTSAGATRLVFARAKPPYPAVEHYLAVGVAGADKERDSFDELWTYVTGLDLPRQLALSG